MASNSISINQCHGQCLLNGIQEQTAARKAGNPLSIHGRNQRNHTRVQQVRLAAQLNFAAGCIAGCCYSGVGNDDAHNYYETTIESLRCDSQWRIRSKEEVAKFDPSLATPIYSFAIDTSLLNFQELLLPEPLYPPGQVKKALKGQ
jgi:hypothetical protein